MPDIIIDNKLYEIPQKNANILKDIPDSSYGVALKAVDRYMNSIDYKTGETIEDVFNILVAQEREANINKLIKSGNDEIDKKYAESLKKIEDRIKEETAQYYEAKAKRRQEKSLEELSGDFVEKWEMSSEEARKTVLEGLLGKDYEKTKNKDLQDEFLAKVAKGQKDFDEKDINGDAKFFDKVKKYKAQAEALLDYASTQKEIESKAHFDRYVTFYVKHDYDNYYKNNLEGDFEYVKLTDKIKAEKEDVRKEAVKKVDESRWVKEPIKDGLTVYLQKKQEDKDNFREVIEKRNDLVSQYKSTNIFSRIARWCLPNSWSEAGKIQDKIDELDKAVKKAGYNQKDVEAVQKEIRGENERTDTEVNFAEPEKNDDKEKINDTLDLQNDLSRDSVSSNKENTEKIIDSKEIGEKERIQ